MPIYQYVALTHNKKQKKGLLQASSEHHAKQQLKENALKLVSLKLRSSKTNKGVSDEKLILVTRQMALLLDSDTPLEESLKIAADQSTSQTLTYVFYEIRDAIMQGQSIALALQQFPKIFQKTYISLVYSGYSSGNLKQTYQHLSNYLEESLRIKQKITAALIYPAIVFGFSVFAIVLFFLVVLPKITEQFVTAGVQLPILTRLLIGASQGLPLILVSTAVLGFIAYLKRNNIIKYLKNKDSFYLGIFKLPFIGPFLLSSELERFSSIILLYLNSGITIDLAFKDSLHSLKNPALKKEFMKVYQDMQEGKDFIMGLKKIPRLPTMFYELMASGYRSGNMRGAFEKVSQFLKFDLENKRNILLGALEPTIILVMGGFILVLVMAIIIPILKMNTLLIN